MAELGSTHPGVFLAHRREERPVVCSRTKCPCRDQTLCKLLPLFRGGLPGSSPRPALIKALLSLCCLWGSELVSPRREGGHKCLTKVRYCLWHHSKKQRGAKELRDIWAGQQEGAGVLMGPGGVIARGTEGGRLLEGK